MDARLNAENPEQPPTGGDPVPPRNAAIVEHHLAQAGRVAQFLVHELNNQLTGILGFAQVPFYLQNNLSP